MRLFGLINPASLPGGRPAQALLPFIVALALVAVATVAGTLIAPHWGNSAVDLLYLPAVLAVAIVGGLRPALLSAVASAIAFNFFFTAPRHTFRIDNPVDVMTVAVLLIVAVVASQLAASVREQAQSAAERAARDAATAKFAGRLLSSTSDQEIAKVATEQLATLFDCKTVLIAARPETEVVASSPNGTRLSRRDLAAAGSTLETGKAASVATSRDGRPEWQFHSIRSKASVIAAVGFTRNDGSRAITSGHSLLLRSLLDQLALAFERARLEGHARELAALRERDRIRASLLATIGQDLKPRLANATGALNEVRRSCSANREAVASVSSELVKLDQYVSNLVGLGLDAEDQPLETGGVKIDLFRREVSRDGKEVHLAPKEFAVLAELAKQPGRVFTHAHLLRAAWGPAQETRTEYLRVAVRGLRQKLEHDPAQPRMIVNEPTIGYRLVLS